MDSTQVHFMVLWVLLAAIAGVALLWIARPLMRKAPLESEDRAVAAEGPARAHAFRAALAARGEDGGTDTADQAELARALIAEMERAAPSLTPDKRPKALPLLLAAIVPLAAILLYLASGAVEGVPSAMAYGEQVKLKAIVRELTERVAEKPGDAEGFRLLALAQGALGDYGAVLAALDKALAIDPHHLRTRLQRAEARFALGDTKGAEDDWGVLLRAVPAGSPAAQILQGRIDTVRQADAVAKTAKTVDDLDPAARSQMIEGMVEGLAARLAANPKDLPGWQRLVNSYVVLGQKDKAQTALKDARRAFAGDAQAQAALDEAGAEIR